MPAEFNAPEADETARTDGLMFSSTPLWERGQRRRKRATPPSRDPAMDAGEPAAATAAEPTDPAYETQAFSYDPIRPAQPRKAMSVGALAAGVAAIAVVGALGWYMNRPAGGGVAELTPGAPESSPITLAAAPPVAPVTSSQPAPPPATPAPNAIPSRAASDAAAPAPSRTPQRTARASTSRVRPAQAAGATEAGVDASAVAPMIEPPAPAAPKLGPTLSMPAEQVAPSLDPAPPSGASSPPATTTTPVAPPPGGEVITP